MVSEVGVDPGTALVAEALGGGAGAAFSVCTLYPVEYVKNKVTVSQEPKTTVEVIRDTYTEGGLLGFYKGMPVGLCTAVIEKTVYFFSYAAIRKYFANKFGASGATLTMDLIAGSLADWSHLGITMPLDTLLMKIVSAPKHLDRKEIIDKVIQDKGGIMGMYSGISAYCVLALKPAIQLALFEFVKARILKRLSKRGKGSVLALPAAYAFVTAAFSRCVATMIVYPYIRGKVLLQCEDENLQVDLNKNPVAQLHDVMRQCVARYGLGSLYNGLRQELTRSMVSAAIMLTVREKFTEASYKMLTGAKK
jgi:solute carrier family 25 phosphate transporter 23/24/25/41